MFSRVTAGSACKGGQPGARHACNWDQLRDAALILKLRSPGIWRTPAAGNAESQTMADQQLKVLVKNHQMKYDCDPPMGEVGEIINFLLPEAQFQFFGSYDEI